MPVPPRGIAVRLIAALAVAALLSAACPSLAADTPTQRVADGSFVGATLSNFGFIGNNFVSTSPSLEYPLGSGIEHANRIGLWFGAQALDVNGTFVGVVTGCTDGPSGPSAFNSSEFSPLGDAFIARSNLTNSPIYSNQAVSELDLISTYDDHIVKRAASNNEDHRPMGITVRQTSYAWGFSRMLDILFVRFTIINTGPPLHDAWVGLYSELVSGDRNAYSCWPPSSACSAYGSWFRRAWLRYEPAQRLLSEHYCAGGPVPGGCQLERAPYWIGLKLLTVPDAGAGQAATLGLRLWNSSDPALDQDIERYEYMSAGVVADVNNPALQPGVGDPTEMLAIGPFPTLFSFDSVTVDFAIVGAPDTVTLADRALLAQLVYGTGYGDPVTPVALSLVSVEATPDDVRLSWWMPGTGRGAIATIERREAATAWAPIGEAAQDATGQFHFADRDVRPGARYAYRARVGADGESAETWVDVPARLALALEGARPNPTSSGQLSAAFTLPTDAPASLDLFDLAGRRVHGERLANPSAGAHLVPLTFDRAIAPGVYVLRLTQSGASRSARVFVTR